MQSRISKRAVDALAAAGTLTAWLWDSEIKGFGVRCRGESKVYLVRYRLGQWAGRTNPNRYDRPAWLSVDTAIRPG